MEKRFDLGSEAYEMSSELFKFKDMRRGVIEHGKACYVEGYKKCYDLFSNFLLSNGYFSYDELNKVSCEFESSLTDKPAITTTMVWDTILKLKPDLNFKLNDKVWNYLTMAQQDIIAAYSELGDNYHTLKVQKPRHKGVSTILDAIAYIEAENGKKVIYFKPDHQSNDIDNKTSMTRKNLKLKCLHTGMNDIDLCGERADLIIVDEIICTKLKPYDTHFKLLAALNPGGKLILTGTPRGGDTNKYERWKKFFTRNMQNETNWLDSRNYKNKKLRVITLSVNYDGKDIERAKENPEYKNEILGQW